MKKKWKGTVKIIHRNCAVCGDPIRVKLDKNNKTRGGHYFSGIGEAIKKVTKRKGRVEYWECPACYWGYKKKLV